MKRCCRCKQTRPLFDFNRNRANADQLSKQCKPCRVEIRAEYNRKHAEKIRAQQAQYRARTHEQQRARLRRHYESKRSYYILKARARHDQTRRVPPWADMAQIERIYALANACRRAGIDCHVDHIVPLKSDLVCGLHVQDNLAITQREDNARKSNRWWPDMPTGDGWR